MRLPSPLNEHTGCQRVSSDTCFFSSSLFLAEPALFWTDTYFYLEMLLYSVKLWVDLSVLEIILSL